jgi:soluble P-type ATPase
MISIDIPGSRRIDLEHLVLDMNGTLAVDGNLVDGVADRIRDLSNELAVHIVTADTFGRAGTCFEGLPCEVVVLPQGDQDVAKARYVRDLGAGSIVAIGNGRNDAFLLETAALGIAVILEEGAAAKTLLAADIVTTSITSALDLLTHPQRLVATLRR